MKLLTVGEVRSRIGRNQIVKVPINAGSILNPNIQMLSLEVIDGSLVMTDEISNPSNTIESFSDFDKLPSKMEDDTPFIFTTNLDGYRSNKTYGVVGLDTRFVFLSILLLDYTPVYYVWDQDYWKSGYWESGKL
ncbi:hypothetical protein LIS04_164 [Listeria phage LIS04]|nr:hypothetical protein LIS04_164 [Listeria phage LIS04]